MVVKDVIGLMAGIVVLAGIAYAIWRGDETVKIIGAAGDAFAGSIVAATPRGRA